MARASSATVVSVAVVLASGRVFAQAEEAPASYEPPPGVPISADPGQVASEREAKQHPWLLVIQPRLVISLGNSAGLPRVGWGVGMSIGRAVLTRGRLRLGVGASFSYERQQRERVPPPPFQNGDTIQWMSHAAFSFDLRLDGILVHGVLRPWMAIGPAVSVASYSDPPSMDSPMGVSETQVLPGLRAAAGIAGAITTQIEIGGRVEWVATFAGHDIGNPPVRPVVPGNFSVGVDVGFRF